MSGESGRQGLLYFYKGQCVSGAGLVKRRGGVSGPRPEAAGISAPGPLTRSGEARRKTEAYHSIAEDFAGISRHFKIFLGFRGNFPIKS